jgi:hypothetical protein
MLSESRRKVQKCVNLVHVFQRHNDTGRVEAGGTYGPVLEATPQLDVLVETERRRVFEEHVQIFITYEPEAREIATNVRRRSESDRHVSVDRNIQLSGDQ